METVLDRRGEVCYCWGVDHSELGLALPGSHLLNTDPTWGGGWNLQAETPKHPQLDLTTLDLVHPVPPQEDLVSPHLGFHVEAALLSPLPSSVP